jgi:hypothetical protein
MPRRHVGAGTREHGLRAKVFCIGFHKTGTKSLGRALRHLGYDVAGTMGTRDASVADTVLDRARARSAQFDAFQDNPWPLLFREMDAMWPGSRFVLTVRDLDGWLRSVVNYFGAESSPMREWIYGPGHGSPLGREAIYRARHERHLREVRAHFAGRERDLLVMDLPRGDGWPQLCAFLGEPVPDLPFPFVNAAARGARRAGAAG